jgi:ankyrin repeat protein
VVDALLDTTTSAQQGKNKALLLAAAHDNLATLVGRLIAGGANVNAARPGDGATPLCIACKHGNVAMVERLIAAGGRVNIASTAGVTPLMFAAQDNRLDVLKLLIAAGADVNMARADGWTPLHIAAQRGHAGVVSVLVKTPGVDLNPALTDGGDAGSTPLFIVAENIRLDILTLLIAAGADVNKARATGCTPLLYMAAQRGHAGVVSVLIETPGVDLNAALTDGGNAGSTPLFIAAQENRLDVVTLLIAAGADVNKACVDGVTPFHMAAQNGQAAVVDLLIAAGANVHATLTSSTTTALSLALAQGHDEVVQKLRAAGAN